MDPQKITRLAKLLKSEGDKVLNNEYKLTLSGTLLRALNDSFTLIINTADESPFGFQVIRPSDAKSDVFRDLQFIYDFVQKTVTLSITGRYADDEKFEGQIDISKFVNLKTIELQKVAARKVIGLQQFRAHLEQLICVRGLCEGIRELIVECGGDGTATGFLWNDLKTADFSYNNLKSVDNSFEYTPYLETLNLSHNQLVDVTPIRCLPSLKVVDLSYNRLTKIPIFHADVYRKLQTLSIVANFIEDINDVANLDALMVLDLSCNCLLDHGLLLPLTALISLQELNLLENPLSCHPKHRQATARYLHKNTSTVKFCLDGEPLSHHEKSLTGVYENYRPILKSKPSESSMIRVGLLGRNYYGETPVGSINSMSSFGIETKFNDSQPEDLSASMISQQRRVKVREAKIASEPSPSLEKDQRRSLEGNTEHLETKKQMETLREQYGNQWLQNTSGDIVKSVVGFESKGKADKTKAFIDSLLQAEMTSSQLSTDMNLDFSNAIRSSTPNEERTEHGSIDSETVIGTDYQSLSANETKSDYKSVVDGTLEQESTVNASTSEPELEPEITVSDPEDDEVTYICVNEQTEEEIFLVVSERNIRERDTLTGRTFTKWSLKSLLSCERIKSDVISLQFDTVKKNKKLRNYRLEKSSCEKLVQLLRKHLEQRPLNEMNQKLYRCAVCIAQFSREDKPNNKEIFCPECKSSYVIEITEAPNKYSPSALSIKDKTNTPKTKDEGDQTTNEETLEQKIPKSDSRSSMASSGSNQDSSSCSKISKSESSFDSNRSIAGSGPSDRDTDFQGNDSDIEVLSNPSQSSIEVLDSLHSSRKHSEERRNLQFSELDMPQGLETIYNLNTTTKEPSLEQERGKGSGIVVKSEATTQTAVLPNKHLQLLTESSSSGSVTDSICTAYEQNNDETLTPSHNTMTDETAINKTDSGATPSKSEVTSVIGTMFNDFLKSNLLLKGSSYGSNKSRDIEISDPNECTERYVFSYTDFTLVDHRLKLHLFQNIFEDDGERLKWLIKARVYDENTTDSSLQGFDCLFVMSTTKFYILKKIRQECDDPSLWLKRFISGTVDRIITARVLPFKTGITFTIRGIGNVHLLLFDIMRTDSLLLFFATENGLPESCSIEYRISEDLIQKLNAVANQQKVFILSFLKSFRVEKNDQKTDTAICAFIVSDTGLFITTNNFKWFSASETIIEVEHTQSMSNLIEVLDVDPQTLQFNFMDDAEDEPVEESWQLTFETDNSSDSAFETVSQCWEKIFSVPLTKISNSSKNNSKIDV